MDTERSAEKPHFSLVLSTKDRAQEVVRLLSSLDRQSERSFELIVSDQNDDGRVLPLLAPFQQRFPVRYVRSSGGISRGRNAGLPLVTGRYVAFPDDDCWYPSGLLALVRQLLGEHPEWDIVTGRSVDEQMHGTQGRWLDRTIVANRHNVMRMGISYTIFARAAVIAEVGLFDEALGVGSGTRWQSGEETDYLLRAITCGRTVVYTPELYVHHLEKVTSYSKQMRDRSFKYAQGMGRVLRKHDYSLIEAFQHFVRPLGGSALFLVRGHLDRSLYHLRVFTGRCRGWLGI